MLDRALADWLLDSDPALRWQAERDLLGDLPEVWQPDGTWPQAGRRRGRTWFEVDVPAGEPSRWLTLMGTRVLDWWDRARMR